MSALSIHFSQKTIFMIIILAVLLAFLAYNWSVVTNLWGKILGFLQTTISPWKQ